MGEKILPDLRRFQIGIMQAKKHNPVIALLLRQLDHPIENKINQSLVNLNPRIRNQYLSNHKTQMTKNLAIEVRVHGLL